VFGAPASTSPAPVINSLHNLHQLPMCTTCEPLYWPARTGTPARRADGLHAPFRYQEPLDSSCTRHVVAPPALLWVFGAPASMSPAPVINSLHNLHQLPMCTTCEPLYWPARTGTPARRVNGLHAPFRYRACKPPLLADSRDSRDGWLAATQQPSPSPVELVNPPILCYLAAQQPPRGCGRGAEPACLRPGGRGGGEAARCV
jgi:hypothetical protein